MSGGVFSFNFTNDGDRGDRSDRESDGIIPMDTNDDSDLSANKRRTQRETSSVMTTYEKTRIIGARATLLSQGARPFIETNGEKDHLKIATKELYAGVLPMIVSRQLPNGTIEEWSVQELRLPPQ